MNPKLTPAALREKIAAAKAGKPEGLPNPPPAGPPALPLEPAMVSVPEREAAEWSALKVKKVKPGPVITYQCKHTVGIVHLESQKCPCCRDQARRDKAAKKRAEAEAKRTLATPADSGKAERDGRLPDGARFVVVYD